MIIFTINKDEIDEYLDDLHVVSLTKDGKRAIVRTKTREERLQETKTSNIDVEYAD